MLRKRFSGDIRSPVTTNRTYSCLHVQYQFFCPILTKFVISRLIFTDTSNIKFHIHLSNGTGPGSVVGIATSYGLDGPGIESRWGRDFPHLSRPALGVHPVSSCTMGTGSFHGVKTGQGVTLTLHPLLVPWSWKGNAIPLLPLWAVSLYRAPLSVQGCNSTYFTCLVGADLIYADRQTAW
jgi:hypothetical protein